MWNTQNSTYVSLLLTSKPIYIIKHRTLSCFVGWSFVRLHSQTLLRFPTTFYCRMSILPTLLPHTSIV